MKREFLEGLGLEKEVIDKVMAENGKDIEAEKTKTKNAEADRDRYKEQLDTTNEELERFKDVKPDELQQTIADLQRQIKDKDAEYAAKEADRAFKESDGVGGFRRGKETGASGCADVQRDNRRDGTSDRHVQAAARERAERDTAGCSAAVRGRTGRQMR